MVVAFIPARGGSKRLPGKNMRPLAGRPLIAYSIALARSVPAIDRCIVSTDDDRIAEVAQEWGAEVVRRPAELATDTATTAAVAQHALQAACRSGDTPEIMLTLQPTNPLRTVALVEEGLALFRATRPDSVISVAPLTLKPGRIVDNCFLPDYVPGTRAQDLPERFYETGLLYVTDARLVEQGDLFGRHIVPLRTDHLLAVVDIDVAADWDVAEALYERYRHLFPYMTDARAEGTRA
jgi:CMP-N-acetylneuraminic acid synthetase